MTAKNKRLRIKGHQPADETKERLASLDRLEALANLVAKLEHGDHVGLEVEISQLSELSNTLSHPRKKQITLVRQEQAQGQARMLNFKTPKDQNTNNANECQVQQRRRAGRSK